MEMRDFVVRFAGEGGQGVVTSAEGLAQAATQVGYHALTFATFPSQILGGPTWTQARISVAPSRSPGDDVDVRGTEFIEKPQYFWDDGHVGAGQQADNEHVHILLDGGLDDLLRGAVEPGIDDVHASVAQRARDDFDAAVVAVEPDLGQQHPNDAGFLVHRWVSSVVTARFTGRR